jgi:hypothetical protein
MGFSQMGHLVKLNIRNDIISQNDQCSLVKWDILCLLNTHFLPPMYNFTTYLPTYPLMYLNVLLIY